MKPAASAAWPHVRACLIALHVLAIFIGSLPVMVDERGMKREAWADPLVQEEFANWAVLLQGWGADLSAEELEEHAWQWSGKVLRVQSALRGPFEPYYALCGTRQRWRMFPAPVPQAMSFQIEIEEAGAWRTLYEFQGEGMNWHRDWFDQDRMRAALNLYAWNVYPEAWEQAVDWLAGLAAEDFPSASRIRVCFPVVPALTVGEARAGMRDPGADHPPPRQEAIRQLKDFR